MPIQMKGQPLTWQLQRFAEALDEFNRLVLPFWKFRIHLGRDHKTRKTVSAGLSETQEAL